MKFVIQWLERHVRDPLWALLKTGIEPQRLAQSVALGIVVGNIPILGVSTLLCTGLALVLRLNLPAIQAVQAAMAPTQILLIIPFVRLGEWLLRAPRQAVSVKEGMALISHGVGHAVYVLWDAIVHAGFAWLLVAGPATWLLQRLLAPLFERAAAKINARPAAGSF